MSRSTHNRSTVNPQKVEFKSNIKTSNKVLQSLEALGEVKEECTIKMKTIPHVNMNYPDKILIENADLISKFADLIQSIIPTYKSNEELIKEQDDFITDMLHEIELGPPKDLGRAYKCYSDIRNSRNTRRIAKNQNRLLTPLYLYIRSNPQMIDDIKSIADKCALAQRDILNASYTYRTIEEDNK